MDEPLVVVLRSVTRAYTLSVLAGTRIPQTAYRIAKLAGLSAPNVYLELGRLEKAGVVKREPKGWLLVNEKVRAFCEGTGPLNRRRFSLQDRVRLTQGDVRPLGRAQIRPKLRDEGTPGSRMLREFSRSKTKNALLRAAGLRTSRHAGG